MAQTWTPLRATSDRKNAESESQKYRRRKAKAESAAAVAAESRYSSSSSSIGNSCSITAAVAAAAAAAATDESRLSSRVFDHWMDSESASNITNKSITDNIWVRFS